MATCSVAIATEKGRLSIKDSFDMMIQWAQTKLVHGTLVLPSVLCTSLVCAHCINISTGAVTEHTFSFNFHLID